MGAYSLRLSIQSRGRQQKTIDMGKLEKRTYPLDDADRAQNELFFVQKQVLTSSIKVHHNQIQRHFADGRAGGAKRRKLRI